MIRFDNSDVETLSGTLRKILHRQPQGAFDNVRSSIVFNSDCSRSLHCLIVGLYRSKR